MSQQIDNQIVKMQFDNASFEKNVQQSMSTLDKLKQALKFDKVDMTPLQQAFSETEATATKAGFHIRDIWLKIGSIIEQEVAQKVVDAGKKMLNALSFEGINDGFKEYELKMGSIQTIMAGTGESLATVNRYLDDLNAYSDQTIYSFSDMTQNIGKFTNAGVKLRDAVDAIKGIANEAAVSGANANEASRAMYNFAQALSAGYVKLIDWKSIENANMATKEFKETLLDVAVAMGNAEKTADGMYRILTENNKGSTMDDLVSGTKNFNDSLQYQWMTTEVLTKALKLYATDVRTLTEEEKNLYEQELKGMGLSDQQIEKFEQLGIKATDAASEIKTFSMMMDTLKEAIGSGWAMTWQLIIGDFEQAKALWTSVGNTLSNVIDQMSDSRNKFLKAGLQTGWEEFTTMEGKAIPQAEKFREILVDLGREHGALSKEQYIAINSTETLMKSFHELGWITGDLLKESVADYTAMLESMSDAEIDEFGIKPSDVEQMKKFNQELQDGTINADEFAHKMTELGGRENVIKGLSNIFHSLLDVIRPIGEAFDDVFGIMDPQKLFNLTQRFREFTEELKVSEDAANTIKTAFTLAFGGIKTVIDGALTALSGVSKLVLPLFNLFDAIFGLIGKIVSALTGSKGALDAADKFGEIGDKIGSKYLKVMQKLADVINKIADGIRNIPESTVFVKIHDGVESAITSLQNFWNEFVNLPVIQQMINDFNNTIAEIERKITPVVKAVEKAFDDLKTKVKSNLNLETLNSVLTKVYDKVKQFLTLVKDFAGRIKDFFTNLKNGKGVVESFRDSFGDIIDRVKELKNNLKEFFDEIFSKGDEMGSKFNLADIQQAIHDFVTNITPDQITMIAVAGTFMLIALNMLRLSEAMKNAVDAFTGVGVALKNVINSYIKKQKSTILQVAEAIVIVAAALWVLSTIPQDQLSQALGAIAILTALITGLTVALTLCGIAMHKFGGKRSMVELASGLVFVSGAFMVAVLALKALEYVKLDGILPKIATLAVIMVGLVGLSALMAKLDKFNKGSLTMIAVAGALLIAAEALARVGSIPKDKLANSLEVIFKMMIGLAAVTFAAGKVGIFSAVGLIAVIMTLDKILPMIEKIVNYDYTNIEGGLKKNEEILKKVGLLVGAMVIIGALAGNRLKGAAIAMLSISATFAILVGVAKLASMMDPRDLRQGELFIYKMAGIIALLELCSQKSRLGMFGGKGGGEGSKVFIRVAITMGLLLGIAKLASMMSVKDIAKGELAVLGLVGLVLAMTQVAKMASGSEGVMKSVATMIFAVSTILAEVAILSMIPLDNMKPALAAILSIIGALALFALAVAKNVHVFDKATMTAKGAAPLIVSMIMVGVLGGILVALAKQPIEGVKSAATGMMAVIASVAMVAAALGRITGSNTSAAQAQAFIESALLVGIVAGVLFVLCDYMKQYNLDPNTMLKAAGSIAIVMAGITPALVAIGLAGKLGADWKTTLPVVIGAIGALAAVGAAIGLLSHLGKDGDSMVKSAIALAIGVVAISVPIAVLGAVGKFAQLVDLKTMATIVGGAVVSLAAVAGSLWFLSNYANVDTILPSVQALSIGMMALCVPMAVLAVIGQFCNNVKFGTVATIVGGALVAMGGVALILTLFANNIDEGAINRINQVMPSLLLAVAAVGALAVAISAAGLLAGGQAAIVGTGFLAVVAAVGGLAIIITAIAGLGYALQGIQSLQGALETGLDMLIVIAGKLGEAIGAFIGGIGVGLSNQVITIADNLTKFSEKLIPFSENMAKVNEEAVKGCKNIAAAMLYLTAAEFLEGIGRLIGFGKIDINFGTLGDAIADFCMAIKDVPEDAVSKASICSVIAKRLAEVSGSLDAKGGLAGLIFGDKESLDDFAEGVAKFGHAILSFCQSVKGLPDNAPEIAQNASDAAVPMVELSKTLYGSGGWVQKIMGEKNLGDFGTNLTSFATSLKAFVKELVAIEAISPIYGDLIRNCADATTPMVDLAAGIKNAGGFLSKLVGDNTLDMFGSTLIPFANDLRIFVNRLNSMASEVPNYNQLIINVVSCTKHLVELANNLENMGGVAGFFSGDNTLDRFGKTLVGFGESLSAYATSISGIDIGMIESANTGITELIQLGAMASGVRADAFSGLKLALEECSKIPVTTVANEITIGTPIAVQAVTNLFNSLLTTMVNRVKNDVARYTDYGKQLVMGIKNGILRNYSQIIPALSAMVNSIKNYLSEHMAESRWNVYGKNIVYGIKAGVNNNYPDINGALASMIISIQNYLSDNMKSSKYEAYGMYIAQGIKKGIEDHSYEAIDAARRMVEAINAEIEKVEKIDSPSKVTYGYGRFIALGLANGIKDYTSEAVSSATEMSEEIIDSANSIISSITAALNSDMDMQPVIRPVLDTSDIESKAKRVGQLFNSNDLALAYAASGSMNQIIAAKVSASVSSDQNQPIPVGTQQINFTQNNYSPKALNRYEIYRQTNNQIRQLKGALV